ncbi:MAG TPA: hypothetical protein PK156_16950 [Polyangium sp.]|nr:hypothetical protein [Polyangium sp.]
MKQELTSTRELQTRLNLGEYTIVASQSVAVGPSSNDFTFEQKFVVAGPRFALESDQVVQMFPPPNTNGDYNNFVPYVTLRRATLPWERQVDAILYNHPFLALLILSEKELADDVKVKSVLVEEFRTSAQLPSEDTDDVKASISVVEAEWSFLQSLLPTLDDLLLSAHVRQWKGEMQEAVILGNRRPLPNTRYAVHLVSLEGRRPDMVKVGKVQLPSLFSWEFTCGSDSVGLVERLQELNCDGLRLPKRAIESAEYRALRHAGYAALPYRLAWGDRTHGLYRGPLVPVTLEETLQASCNRAAGLDSGEGLVDYFSNLGLADFSFSAAWELGRMLMLRRRDVAMSYFRFRREQSALAGQLDNAVDQMHLLIHDVVPTLADIPPNDIVSFCKDLIELRGVPFPYLVPDPRMLPKKSLRVFQIDERWICCLVGGALSLGRARTRDRERELVYLGGLMAGMSKRSGILIRSPVVAERPRQTYLLKLLQGTTDVTLKPLFQQRLSTDVLLLVVEGLVQKIEASEEPKAAQFGFKEGGLEAEYFQKDLRNPATFEEIITNTTTKETLNVILTAAHYRNLARGVLNVAQLARDFNVAHGAIKVESHHYALQLIESGAGGMTIPIGGAFT